MSKKADSKGKKGGKRKPKGQAVRNDDDFISVAAHPRARAHVRRAKGWGGLLGFVLAAYLSLSAGVPADEAGLRAIVGGFGGYLLAWAVSVTVWRQLVLAELHLAADRIRGIGAEQSMPADSGRLD